jgi:methionyl-tRNA synthetase
VLAFLATGLDDISVSRSDARARGWGIPVPDDPTQRIYVWWDALGNYVTALDYGIGGEPFDHWWCGADERIHVIGKGILRFHAVYWPAILLSAGVPLPTKILVHPYLTAGGEKLSKSAGTSVDPADVVAEVGTDALRWWFARDVPRAADADFSVERVIARADEDLAHGIGNLVHRVTTMVHRLGDGVAPPSRALGHRDSTRDEFDAAVRAYDYRRAVAVVRAEVDAANRRVEELRPWTLPRESDALDGALAELLARTELTVELLHAIVPATAGAAAAALTPDGAGRLPPPAPLVPLLSR